jgi:hypothetical protein
MAVTTILVESDEIKLKKWTDYIKEYDRETSKTKEFDLEGLGKPQVASGETLEEVLDLMGKTSGGVALIYAHANPKGLIMSITTQSTHSSESKYLRGISRAWNAIDEIMPMRSGKWPASGKGAPEFFIDVPKAVRLFQTLKGYLSELGGGYETRLDDPLTVTDRNQADAWFNKWMELMGNACLGGSLGETALRRVCRAMQKVREARIERVEFRSCDIGKVKENLNVLKEFFGVRAVVAPKVPTFYGYVGVSLPLQGQRGDLDDLARKLGGFRGNRFTQPAAVDPKMPKNERENLQALKTIAGGEAEVVIGRRNRIFPIQGQIDAIMMLSQVQPYEFKGKLFSPTSASLNGFLRTNYKADYSYSSSSGQLVVGGLWSADDGSAKVPYLLPLEDVYRDFLVISD